MGNRNFLGNFFIIIIIIGIIFMVRSCYLKNMNDIREEKAREKRLEDIAREQYRKNPNYEIDEYEMDRILREELEEKNEEYREKWDDPYEHYY